MKYKKYNKPNYKLHVIKTNKFKTITIRIVFRNIIKKEEITIRNFLQAMLCYTTKNYPNKVSMSKQAQELYGADIYGGIFRAGKYINMDISLSILNPKYTEETMYEESIEFLREVIFNPNVENNIFDKEKFLIVKNFIESTIKTQKENSQKYIIMKMLEDMDDTKEFSYRMSGYLEDLNKITEKSLYEYYKKVLFEDAIDIFVIGDFSYTKINELFSNYFIFPNNKRNISKEFTIENNDMNIPYKEHVYESSLTQSKLAVGCKLINLTRFEKDYVLPVYNHILGGESDSKFFANIRENNSLAYYINSVVNKFDGVLIIKSGINSVNYSKVMELILSAMQEIEEGKFEVTNIDNAKNYYLNSIKEIEDYPKSIIDTYYASEITNSDSIEVKTAKIKEVTKEDILKVAKKIKIDTVCLLKEGV